MLCLLGAAYEECQDEANDGNDGAYAERDGAGVFDGIGMDGKVVDEADEEEENTNSCYNEAGTTHVLHLSIRTGL